MLLSSVKTISTAKYASALDVFISANKKTFSAFLTILIHWKDFYDEEKTNQHGANRRGLRR